jgi:alpha-tubulin suppressor-like RCC1 family protein
MAAAAAAPGAWGEANESAERPLQQAAITAGPANSCALGADGKVRCWGHDNTGQLGDGGSNTDTSSPSTPVALGQVAVGITAGNTHVCALLADASVRCWGYDGSGALGDGPPMADTSSPSSAVALGQGARAIAAEDFDTCALLADGTVRCWGDDAQGALGDGPPIATTTSPSTAVALGQRARAIAGGFASACALLDDASVRCWGYDFNGQLGDGLPKANTDAPSTPVALGQGTRAIAAGTYHVCALLADGSVRCWGDDTTGQLGDGLPLAGTASPAAPVSLGQAATAITAGGGHTCALLADGSVRCWGDDTTGQLGDGPPYASTNTPSTPVALGQPARAITAGYNHTCALLVDATLRCWGSDNLGQLGNGLPNAPADAPASAVGLPPMVSPDSADVSLTATPASASVQAGGQVTVNLTVANAGPDATTVAVAAPLPDGLALVSALPAQGTYSTTSGVWRTTLAPNSTATLILTARAIEAGTTTLIAEVVDSTALDLDSTPANDDPAEDDRAATSVAITQAPVATPTPTPTPRVTKVRPDSLSVSLSPRRDRTLPLRFTARASMIVTKAALATACKGTITFTAKAGSKTVLTQRAPLRLLRGTCSATATLTIRSRARTGKAKALAIRAAFAGNAALTALTSRAASARIT